jgi:dTDP-4-dehydrorhamnose 3,5-epimerase
MDVRATAIPEVKVIIPARYGDHRGFFSEVYSRRALAEAGIDIEFVQDNHSYSATRGTLRGLHFQRPSATQTKLVRVLRGAIVDVAVDCRVGSPTYGDHVIVELAAGDGRQLLCPKGFAHGTLTLEADTEITYKVDAYYAPELDFGLRWDDPTVGIDWPLAAEDIVLSERDRNLPTFEDLPKVFSYL